MPPKGYLQRAAAVAAARPDSELARYLKESSCFGKYSATEVQRVAALACADHAQNPRQLEELAHMGTDGLHPNHCSHQLETIIDRSLPDDMPELLNLEIPMNIKNRRVGIDDDDDENYETGMLAPYDWFSFIL